ncbi:MAG: class I SAM-dependent methyltransferase [Halieaceae bacterium]
MEHWRDLLRPLLSQRSEVNLLELACGNGELSELALQAAPGKLSCVGVDLAMGALGSLRQRLPTVLAVAADLKQTPFADGSFELVVSQFGVEYAGLPGFQEAARLLRPGGDFAAVVHYRGGAIYRECATNLEVAQAIAAEQVLLKAREAFAAGFALNAGSGSVEAFKSAERSFAPAISFLEQTMQRTGRDVATGLVAQLYRDIAYMYQRMSAHAPEDVFSWIDGMASELEAYTGRMQAMLDASRDASEMESIAALMQAAGLKMESAQELKLGSRQEVAAWSLRARRHS